MTKKQVGEERVYSAYTSTLLFIIKWSQDWNSGKSWSRNWCRGHGGMFLTGLLPLACSACSLIEPKNTSPKVVPPTRALPPWSLIEKMPHSWISLRHFPTEYPFSVITPAVSGWHIKPISTDRQASVLASYVLTWHEVKLSKMRDPQMRKWPYQTGLWTSLCGMLLIDSWCRRTHPIGGTTTFGLVL